jgi:hypothetical protein
LVASVLFALLGAVVVRIALLGVPVIAGFGLVAHRGVRAYQRQRDRFHAFRPMFSGFGRRTKPRSRWRAAARRGHGGRRRWTSMNPAKAWRHFTRYARTGFISLNVTDPV